ncbi:MAG TPA: molybdopterin cofactor-binding domain-containing protein, partial [Gaiellaceae bacterium]|nr:molybdopterin cofactor-binding domain-containing protein [Gaiellaceae bacterium]
AAERARELLVQAVAEKWDVPGIRIAFAEGRAFDVEDPDRSIPFAEAVVLAESRFGTIGTVGSYTPPRSPGRYRGAGVGPSPAYSYSAAVAEVTVDPETGETRVEEVWIAHDIGRAINPLLVIGQTEGSVYMALGEALYEQHTFRDGLLDATSVLDYKTPTTLEMPEVHTYLVETIDPNGPFGAKEAGQGPLLPVVPAVANALHDAIGVRIDEVPITPEKVLRALDLAAKGRLTRVGPKAMPEFDFPEPYHVEPPAEPAP